MTGLRFDVALVETRRRQQQPVQLQAFYLSPLPSNRAYVSRTKTIFKYKFEFCLTGFMKDGEVNLTELIEEHGGKIPERYQDVLHKNNPKAVVIATPVSWRKLKFIYAIACGIPVVHPEWIHACVTAGKVVSFDGYFIPSGYSFTTRKFECLSVQQLDIFAGLSFGIPYDVVRTSNTSTKSMGSLISFVLKACGAKLVVEDLTPSRDKLVDIVLSNEYTKTCEYYRKKHKTPLRTFPWVTECMILQRFIKKSKEDIFQPRVYERDDENQASEEVLAVNAEIGDADRTMLKLHTGELVLADLSGNGTDHFLLFHVCKILRIIIHREEDDRPRGEEEQSVSLEVGVLKRSSNSPGLSRTHSKILQIPTSHVKRRVVAVSAKDFQQLEYRDESIFYYEEKGEQDDNVKAK
uniref:BRCT domain-containing protein n=1 Tax=Globisporangium ultimum (strain ATCC 200006 / CBS 805.95 / DAOM BR144) TaxID=431595 RepID=K3WTV5_GLOUD